MPAIKVEVFFPILIPNIAAFCLYGSDVEKWIYVK
jgi:hypothetical protein